LPRLLVSPEFETAGRIASAAYRSDSGGTQRVESSFAPANKTFLFASLSSNCRGKPKPALFVTTSQQIVKPQHGYGATRLQRVYGTKQVDGPVLGSSTQTHGAERARKRLALEFP
jgi:hypothetical protein